MSTRWPAAVALLCLSVLVACAGPAPTLTLTSLGLPQSGKALADVTINTSPDGGIYRNPDPMTVVMVSRASGKGLIKTIGTDASDWKALEPLGDFTFVGVAVRNNGAAGSDPQLNAMQIAVNYTPKAAATGPLSHFYHPMFPLAILSLEPSDQNCTLHLDPGRDAARCACVSAHQCHTHDRLGRVRSLRDSCSFRWWPIRRVTVMAGHDVHAATGPAVMTTQSATLPAWSVHLGTTGSTCVRFACDVVRDSDPWPLSRAVADLAAGGASLAERPRALGSGRGIPLVHSQRMLWRGTTLELEAHHLRDGGNDEVSVTLAAWDELTTASPRRTRSGR